MPIFHDTDDSDAWRDDESMTSTDGFSSHTGDLESIEDSDEYEFLSRSSSRAHTEEEEEEETDSDDQVSTHASYGAASVVIGDSSDDTSVIVAVDDSMEEIADTVLQSTELPRVLPEIQALENSTSTVTGPRQRRGTVTEISTRAAPSGKPFNVVYAGSDVVKHEVVKRVGQALMAATLQDKVMESSASDWSNGYTNVVPVTDFTSDTAPEVEFVEDSLVKMRVVNLDSLRNHISHRRKQFSCQVHTTVVNCHHSKKFTTCAWFDQPDTFPSLLVYCSPVRGETTPLRLKDIALFAEIHHIPILIISELEKLDKRFSYSWNHTNVPIPESEGREVMLGYQPLTAKKFMDLDLTSLGLSLWTNEEISQDAIKTVEKVPIKFDLEKHAKFRIAAGVLVALLLLFFKMPFFVSRTTAPIQVKPNYPLANTPSIKDLGTQYETPSHFPSTVTITETEHMTVTIPIVQTMTVSTTVTPESQRSAAKETSTIVLHPIASSVNVPRASIIPRLPNVDYGYAFGYDDDFVQLYLETENSLLLRLPGAYRESTTSRPAVKVSITRDGKPIHVDLREIRKNDLAFVDWRPEDAYGQLRVKVWTDATPIFTEEVVVDYTDYFIPPQYWEMIERSQKVTWDNLQKMGESVDWLAKDIHSRVADPANYAAVERQVSEYMRKAKQAQSELFAAAEQRYRSLKSCYPNFKDQTWHLKDRTHHIKEQTRHIKDQTRALKDQTRERIGHVLSLAQGEAVRITSDLSNLMKAPSRVDQVKSYWRDRKPYGKGKRSSWIGKGKRERKHQIDRVSGCGKKKCK